MPRVLILAATTGYQVRSFGEAAERAGIDLVYATDRCGVLEDPWQDGALPVRFHEPTSSSASIVQWAQVHGLDGVVAVGDRPTIIAAQVNEALGLPGHPPAAAIAARDKRLTRERLRDAGLPAPWFETLSLDVEPRDVAGRLSFPCVVKPMALSGSRGVIRADSPEEFAAAFERARDLLRTPEVRALRDHAHEELMVEGFIVGQEFALEGVLDRGLLHVFAIFDKPDPLDGPFFEETIYVTPSTLPSPVQETLVTSVARAAAALGLFHGPVHAECRVAQLPGGEGVRVSVLEIAARPIGGLCARALRFRHVEETRAETSLEEVLLRHAAGEAPGNWCREAIASGVMMIPIPGRGILRSVSGVEDARRAAGVEDVQITAKPDQLLVPLPEGASYLGFIFARADDSQAVVGALRAAHDALRFTIDPEVRVLQSING